MMRVKWYTIVLSVLVLSISLSGCIRPRKTTLVPDVVGLHIQEAQELVNERHLVDILIEGVPAEESELEYIVYGQDPEADTRVRRNTSVEMTHYGERAESYKMSIMGFWIGSDYQLCKELGCTHIWSFKQSYIDPIAAWQHGLKTFVPVDGSEAEVRQQVRHLKGQPWCGGYLVGQWHEADLLGKDVQHNEMVYRVIREEDPDKLARPAMVLYDMTDEECPYFPGWKGTICEDYDILMLDDYPYYPGIDPQEDLDKGWMLVSTYVDLDRKQVIPCLQAFYGTSQNISVSRLLRYGLRPFDFPDIQYQYEFWKEKLGTKSMGFYCWMNEYTGVTEDERLQRAVKEVNQDIFE